MVKIEIDGKPLEAEEGSMVINVAEQAGITIPRFCYHSKLSIAASCRMCLVEVEKAPKPMPACATPVADGMKVFTRSPKAISAQRSVMEFLLINHPLDCPICDQGGECDLQEMAMGYGKDVSHYSESKRVVASKNIGPLIATDMTRCIHCTRCVRFGQEIAGMMELGAPGRGEHMHIGTFVEQSVTSELSGNVIDLCPVGALTSKPYRFHARPWELTRSASISSHDCVGANTQVESRNGEVMRVVPRDNEQVNDVWLADRDRFSYTALNHEERLTVPMIKQDGQWQETSWDNALTVAAERLKGIDAKQLSAMAGYNSTNEEYYLLQKLMRGIGSGNVDHRLRQLAPSADVDGPVFPYIGQPLNRLEQLDAVLLIGSNIRKEQPLLAQRLRKAVRNGGKLMAVNPLDYAFNIPLAETCIVSPSQMVAELAAIAKALGGTVAGLDTMSAEVTEKHKTIAATLKEAEQGSVLVGNLALYQPERAKLQQLATLIAELADCTVGVIAEGGNSAGAHLAGCLPHRDAGGAATTVTGRDWLASLESSRGFLLLGTEPERDAIDSGAVVAALQQADCVVAMSAYLSDEMKEYADIVLPIATSMESSGSMVNAAGDWQGFTAAVAAPGEARPAWKVLRVLGNLFDVTGFGYMSSEEVTSELQKQCEGVTPSARVSWEEGSTPSPADGLSRIADFPIYASDSMVRRADPLQQTQDNLPAAIHLSAATMAKLGLTGEDQGKLQQGDVERTLPLFEDDRVADGCIYVACGLSETTGLGAGFAPVQLGKE